MSLVALAPSAQALYVELLDPQPPGGYLEPYDRFGLPILVQTDALDACRPPVEVQLTLRAPEAAAASLEPASGTAQTSVTSPSVYRFASSLNLSIGDRAPALKPFYYGVNATAKNCGTTGSVAAEDGWTYPTSYVVRTEIRFEPTSLRLGDADEGVVVAKVRNAANAPTRLTIEAVNPPSTDWLELDFPSELALPGGGESETQFNISARMIQPGDFQLEFHFSSTAADGNESTVVYRTTAYLRIDSGMDAPGPVAGVALLALGLAGWSSLRRRPPR